MPKDNIEQLAKEVGKLTGVMEGVIRSQDNNAEQTRANTAEIKQFTAFMYKSIGAQEERDKRSRNVKRVSIGGLCLAIISMAKAFAGH